MPTRRTTLAADSDDLALLEHEARRRDVSLTQVLREAVERAADELRRERKPRFGIARTSTGLARAAAEDEDAPIRERSGT
jgi:predicted DNA-binding helix-hairpin-helix protein